MSWHFCYKPGFQKSRYILFFYNISFSWLLPLNSSQFIFLLCDSENDLYYKTAEPKRESFPKVTLQGGKIKKSTRE